MKNLGIITLNHKNRKVLALWCAQIKRLRIELDTYIPAVVVSDEGDKSLCGHYGVWHITQQSAKGEASMKWNTAMAYMRSIGMDAVMILGSDDVISTDFYCKTQYWVELGTDLIGVKNAYFYCAQGLDRGKLVKLEGRNILGIGKTVSSRVLDMADWNLWRVKKDWGMDAMAQKEIDKHTPTKALIDEIIVDVKTRDNLNSFNVFKRRPQVDSSVFLNILSEEEKQILEKL
jgi:hypothetical protein